MTSKPENTSLPEGQNSNAQIKRTDFAAVPTPSTAKELTQKEIIQRIIEKSQIEGNNEGFKSLHR